MEGNEVITLLRQHRADIERFGVKSLALFGSSARDEARAGSDADLLVEFAQPVGLFRFLDLTAYLETVLGCPVDLVARDALKPQLRDAILAEAVAAL